MTTRDGASPRDGKTQLPASDGGAGGPMVDLNKNPIATPSGRATDFSAVQRQQVATKSSTSAGDAPGGKLLRADAPPTRPGGVGSIGNAAKPFRLGGV